MKICINAGHTLTGPGSGAIGIKNESIENRKVAREVIRLLKDKCYEVVDATVNYANTKEEYLRKSVEIGNECNCDLYVSIHFNALDKKTHGTEVLVYSMDSEAVNIANNIVENISKLGFKNRGVKERPGLYILRNTKMPSLIVECCFIDNFHDMSIYNVYTMACAIVKGIID